MSGGPQGPTPPSIGYHVAPADRTARIRREGLCPRAAREPDRQRDPTAAFVYCWADRAVAD